MAKSPRHSEPDPGESRAAVALTIAWMLTCLSTAVGLTVVLALRLLMMKFPVAPAGVHPLGQMATVLLFVTIATGAMCLGLTPLALRVRQTPPPRSITIGAVTIGLLPLVVAAIGAWSSR